MSDRQKDLISKITLASEIIHKTSTKGGANCMIASSQFSEQINNIQKQLNRESKIQQIIEMSEKKRKYDQTYLKMAIEWSNLSHCQRKKVGALIVKNGMIISDGYNGTPSGYDNCCENDDWQTHWYTIHAESNAILKCARWGHSCEGSTLYLTHSPCKDCSKSILQSGIVRVVYNEDYKDLDGVNFLLKSGVDVEKISFLGND
jgi:dCMP deaminase